MFLIRKEFHIILACLFLINQGFSQQASPPRQSVAPVVMKDHRSGKSIREIEAVPEIDQESTKDLRLQSQPVQGNAETSMTSSQVQWLNEYQSKRNTFLVNDGKLSSSEKAELQSIISESKKTINGSFTYVYMQLRESRNKPESKQYLETAIKLEPGNELLLTEIAWQAERRNDAKTREKAVSALEKTGRISALQIKFAEWIISSTPSNALIVSHGENDTYPLWKASKSNHVIISLAMLEDLSWLNSTIAKWDKSIQFKEIPSESQFLERILQSQKSSYLLWTLRPELLKPFENKLFPVGPSMELCHSSQNNLIKLKQFYFTDSVRKYILSDSWRSDPYAPLLGNLIPGIRMLLVSSVISDSERRILKQMEEKIILNSKSK